MNLAPVARRLRVRACSPSQRKKDGAYPFARLSLPSAQYLIEDAVGRLRAAAKESQPGRKKPNPRGVQPRRRAVKCCRPRMYRRQLVRGEAPSTDALSPSRQWAAQTLRTSGPLASHGRSHRVACGLRAALRLALLSPPHPVEQLDTAMTGKITSRHRRNRLDLNSEGDRDYLSSRGFVYALISVGAYRGRVISAHHQRKTVEAYVRDFALNRPVEIVEIAKFA